ncbi:MAG: nucleotidyltransferase family protein [Bacteroidota bacterium]
MNITAILLAAGSSSRMGRSKQLLTVEGQPLLMRAVQAAIHSKCSHTLVVLGSGEERHRKIIQTLPVQIVYNDAWNKGIGSSIKAGMHALAQPSPDGVIILVCDQPLLGPEHIDALIHTHRKTGNPIVASSYKGTVGVPAFFNQMFFDPLMLLEDAAGAKKIIQQNQQVVSSIDFPGGEIDLDTPEDYESFNRKYSGA